MIFIITISEADCNMLFWERERKAVRHAKLERNTNVHGGCGLLRGSDQQGGAPV